MASGPVAFVTADLARHGHADVDRPHHDRAFAAAGIALEHPRWDDPAVDWGRYALVVIRSPWDYVTRLDAFLAWLARVEPLGTVHNPPAVVRWNLDKRYLADLAAAGVPVVPTAFARSAAEVEAALARHAGAEVVVKPEVSAGSRHTGRFPADADAARRLAGAILAEGRTVMVQPCVPSVAERGETSLVFFAGRRAHAFRKGPILAPGGGLLGGSYRERVRAAEPGARLVAAGEAAAAACDRLLAGRFGLDAPLLYARFDWVELPDGAPALLEAELFEPCFFLDTRPAAAHALARAVAARLGAQPSSASGAVSWRRMEAESK